MDNADLKGVLRLVFLQVGDFGGVGCCVLWSHLWFDVLQHVCFDFNYMVRDFNYASGSDAYCICNKT